MWLNSLVFFHSFFNHNRVEGRHSAENRWNGEGEDRAERHREERKRKAVPERGVKDGASQGMHLSSGSKRYVRRGLAILSCFLFSSCAFHDVVDMKPSGLVFDSFWSVVNFLNFLFPCNGSLSCVVKVDCSLHFFKRIFIMNCRLYACL
jgi:hypothetical protein